MKQYLGIDIGGTAVKLGLVDEQGQVLARQEQSVSFDGYKTPILDTVLAAAQRLLPTIRQSFPVLAYPLPGRSTAGKAS